MNKITFLLIVWLNIIPVCILGDIVEMKEFSLPEIQREFRGVWIATVFNLDWPSRAGLSAEKQKAELLTLLDNAAKLNLNAVIFQVRPAADVFYKSKIDPWSEWLAGEQGKDPLWDPLAFIIEEAHKRCLELHAWINPFRAGFASQKNLSDKHISNSIPEIVTKYGNYYWIDPGNPRSFEYLKSIVIEVVDNYDVDGIHFDDYFYPYPVAGQVFDDSETYKKHGGEMLLGNWRRSNIDRCISGIYEYLKKEKPAVQFGISPFGIWRPGNPKGVTGFDSYNMIYADSKKWLNQGWVDYMAPQFYWDPEHPQRDFKTLFVWWQKENKHNKNLYAGINIKKINGKKGETVETVELEKKLDYLREIQSDGQIFFTLSSLAEEKWQTLFSDYFSYPALPPISATANEEEAAATGGLINLKIEIDEIKEIKQFDWEKPEEKSELKGWAIYVFKDKKWDYKIISPHTTTWKTDLKAEIFGVAAIKKNNIIEGPVVNYD